MKISLLEMVMFSAVGTTLFATFFAFGYFMDAPKAMAFFLGCWGGYQVTMVILWAIATIRREQPNVPQ